MPASITHELVAEEAEDLLPSAARETVVDAFDYYILGAQGPDLFFFYRPLRGREENLGRHLHRRQVYDFFTALAMALSGFTGEAFKKCLAYALGYCTHLAADVVFHPFIYRYLQENEEGKHAHQRIENDWDVYFLRELKSAAVLRHAYPFDLKKIAADGVLLPYLQSAFSHIGIEIKPSSFARMLRLFGRYLTHFHKKGVRPLRAFGLAAFYPRRVPDKKFLCGKEFARYSDGQGGSADALFLKAAEESIACMEAFLECFNAGVPLPKSLFSRSLLSGEELPS